ncbi:MAG: YdcF family protein, partial [Acidobacteriaceae bacterium]|nr:YdcF family protein [Acidobacteriaceae bacterium]
GVQSTWAEAGFVGTNLRERHLGKILLVTSNYHTHRAAHLFRERNPGLQVIAVPAPDPDFTPATWWKSREGQKTFLLEWMKTVASWLKI